MNPNDRSIVGVTMVSHAMVHTYELSIPIFMTLWVSEFGVTQATLGLVVGAGYALFGIGALPGGVLADAYGSRRLITACLGGMGASFVVLSAADGMVVVTAALVLWGIAASVYHPSGLSLISKGVEDRGTAFAYHGMAGNAGIGFGPLVTTVLLIFLGWRTVAAVLAVPAALALLLTFRVEFDESAAVTDGGNPSDLVEESRALFASGFVVVFAVVVLSGLYYRGVLTFLPDLLSGPLSGFEFRGIDVEPSRYVYSGLLMVGMLGQYVGGRLTDSSRVKPEEGIAVGFAVLAGVSLVFIPAIGAGFYALVGVSALLGFFLFTVQPLYQATVADYTPAEARGLSYGYTYLGTFGFGALGATIAGFVLTYSGESAMFGVLAGIALTAVALSGFLATRSRD